MADRYVDPLNGNDANGGTTYNTDAWKTLQKAADTAVAGETVYCMNTATEAPAATVDFDTNNGTDDNPITFIGADSSGNALTSGHYTISGSGLGGGVNLITWGSSLGNYVTFKRIRFTAAPGDNLRIGDGVTANPAYLTFYDCRIDTATGNGVYQYNTPTAYINCEIDSNGGNGLGPDPVSGTNRRGFVTMYGCKIHDNTSAGMVMFYDQNKIIGNLIYDNGTDGITVSRQFRQNVIVNNVFHANTASGIGVGANSASGIFDGMIYGNSFVSNGAYGIENLYTQNVTQWIDWNHFHGNVTDETQFASTPGDHNQSGDPLFTSVVDGSENFAPLTGSPLIGNGPQGSNIGTVAKLDVASGGGGSFVFAG